jgi:hypothetical protein
MVEREGIEPSSLAGADRLANGEGSQPHGTLQSWRRRKESNPHPLAGSPGVQNRCQTIPADASKPIFGIMLGGVPWN